MWGAVGWCGGEVDSDEGGRGWMWGGGGRGCYRVSWAGVVREGRLGLGCVRWCRGDVEKGLGGAGGGVGGGEVGTRFGEGGVAVR